MYGLVFQNFNLFPHYSGAEKHYGRAHSRAEEKERERLRRKPESCWLRWGFLTQADMYPCQLSRRPAAEGWQSPEPWLYIPGFCSFDEPTSALDPELTKGGFKGHPLSG